MSLEINKGNKNESHRNLKKTASVQCCLYFIYNITNQIYKNYLFSLLNDLLYMLKIYKNILILYFIFYYTTHTQIFCFKKMRALVIFKKFSFPLLRTYNNKTQLNMSRLKSLYIEEKKKLSAVSIPFALL